MKTKMLGRFAATLSAAMALPIAAMAAADPLASISRMDSRTNDKTRDPGLFGDYWWANRFLSRSRLVEGCKGKTVDLVMLGDSIMHFWEWKHPASWKLRGQALQGARFLWGWSLGTHPAR